MILDNNLSPQVRLKKNVQIFFDNVDANKNEAEMLSELITQFDTIINKILIQKIGFTVSKESDFTLPFSTKVDLCFSKGIFAQDLKRVLYIFIELQKQSEPLDAPENQTLLNELLGLCDNELFNLINLRDDLIKNISAKESLVYIHAVLASALVESLVE